jgi:hypothetical protein
MTDGPSPERWNWAERLTFRIAMKYGVDTPAIDAAIRETIEEAARRCEAVYCVDCVNQTPGATLGECTLATACRAIRSMMEPDATEPK